jgi:hypothetical protein
VRNLSPGQRSISLPSHALTANEHGVRSVTSAAMAAEASTAKIGGTAANLIILIPHYPFEGAAEASRVFEAVGVEFTNGDRPGVRLGKKAEQ